MGHSIAEVTDNPGTPGLNDMDMFLSPFPFGNTNGIVDAFTAGLPGVCKTGREVFVQGTLPARIRR